MRKKVIDSIHNELNLFETTNDNKHLYAVEKLLEILQNHHSNDKNKPLEYKQEKKTKTKLDETYIAQSDANGSSIFDF